MVNWIVTDKWGQTCVVNAHNEIEAIERAHRMYNMHGVTAVKY